jgi:hypothetical protein
MKISYPYGASYEIFDPHALDFHLKTELGQGCSSCGAELSFVLELTYHRMIIIPEGGKFSLKGELPFQKVLGRKLRMRE